MRLRRRGVNSARHVNTSRRRGTDPLPARDGAPFQLANPDLVYELSTGVNSSDAGFNENVNSSAAGRGGDIPISEDTYIYKDRSIDPSPPTPPPQKPCLFEDPLTRENIRRNLKEMEVTNINQLIRTYEAAVLIEAISDYRRALRDGFRPRSPTAYFKTLLE